MWARLCSTGPPRSVLRRWSSFSVPKVTFISKRLSIWFLYKRLFLLVVCRTCSTCNGGSIAWKLWCGTVPRKSYCVVDFFVLLSGADVNKGQRSSSLHYAACFGRPAIGKVADFVSSILYAFHVQFSQAVWKTSIQWTGVYSMLYRNFVSFFDFCNDNVENSLPMLFTNPE